MQFKDLLKNIPTEIKDNVLGVTQRLANLSNLYKSRVPVYGSSYLEHGNVLGSFFPNGVVLNSVEDMNRFVLLSEITQKLSRYAQNFHNNGHQDSMNDIGVYSQMINEFDELSYHVRNTIPAPIDSNDKNQLLSVIDGKEEIIRKLSEENQQLINSLNDTTQKNNNLVGVNERLKGENASLRNDAIANETPHDFDPTSNQPKPKKLRQRKAS